MSHENHSKKAETGKKYYRIKDLANRYGYSRGHVTNLVGKGEIPPPMIVRGVKLWPVGVIEALDQKREAEYFKSLRDQGFLLPEDAWGA